jgi:DNA repair and recombination protein RAD52
LLSFHCQNACVRLSLLSCSAPANFSRPGEQHLNSGGRTIINPFEEVRPRVSEYTAQEIATLQSRLEKQLGPEYISSRAGPSGQKVHYLAAEKCIQLANEVFGFNGWSSQIMDVQVDFVDEHPQTLKITLGLSVIVRVTLKDGTFHEDIGYGHIENCKGKAAAFEKAKKEGTTDALKRALKNFGNVLGNCIYDKEYLAKVTKIKVEKPRWDVANLHRHSDHMPLKKEQQPEGQKVGEKERKGADGANRSELSGDAINVEADDAAATEDMLEDEFGGASLDLSDQGLANGI